jgi:hypothetical protein
MTYSGGTLFKSRPGYYVHWGFFVISSIPPGKWKNHTITTGHDRFSRIYIKQVDDTLKVYLRCTGFESQPASGYLDWNYSGFSHSLQASLSSISTGLTLLTLYRPQSLHSLQASLSSFSTGLTLLTLDIDHNHLSWWSFHLVRHSVSLEVETIPLNNLRINSTFFSIP